VRLKSVLPFPVFIERLLTGLTGCFLPFLMKGKKRNPPSGEEILFPALGRDWAFSLPSVKGETQEKSMKSCESCLTIIKKLHPALF
jgi:hypothetical protein